MIAQMETSARPVHHDQLPTENHPLPQIPADWSTANPVTRFPRDQERRRRTAILVKVWLLISGFYRRALMFDDAKGAVEEAHKLVQEAETEVLKDTTGNVSIYEAGWGGGKSVAELWGDVFSEVCDEARLLLKCSTNVLI